MNKMQKRMLKGILLIVSSMTTAILMTLVYDWLVQKYGHDDIFSVIFCTGGGIIGLAVVMFAFAIWTYNMGDGFKE